MTALGRSTQKLASLCLSTGCFVSVILVVLCPQRFRPFFVFFSLRVSRSPRRTVLDLNLSEILRISRRNSRMNLSSLHLMMRKFLNRNISLFLVFCTCCSGRKNCSIFRKILGKNAAVGEIKLSSLTFFVSCSISK